MSEHQSRRLEAMAQRVEVLQATADRVRVLLSGFEQWKPYQTRDIGGAYAEEAVRDLVEALHAALDCEADR